MGKYYPDTAEYQPDDVHYCGETASIGSCIGNFNPKGSKAYYGKFKTLEPERNAYNGET